MHYKIANGDIEDIGDVFHHWHGPSQKFAGGDSLMTALFLGWSLKKVVLLEKHWRTGARRMNIYHFELFREDEVMAMPVLANPYVERLIAEQGLEVVALVRRSRVPVSDGYRSMSANQVRVS